MLQPRVYFPVLERSTDVRVREADRADLLSVVRIEDACFDQPWPFTAFEGYLDEPGFLVVERETGGAGAERTVDREPGDVDGDPGDTDRETDVVGFVVGDVTPNYGRDIGHVKDLAVDPDHRGEGLGRLLLHSVLARLRWQGAELVKLEVRDDNEPARELYRSEGFEPFRRVPGYYDDGETAIVMVLRLEEWSAE